MVQTVILVHGYSADEFSEYGSLPALLNGSGCNTQHVWLSAYDSLNDDVTCTDLANALEFRIARLEASGVDVTTCAFICHSTGAIIVRRWLLDRIAVGKPLPTHFISLAGANHGSTMSQVGRTILAHIYRDTQGTSVGQEVLEDLDYGSQFLLRLNSDWIDAHNAVAPLPVYSFSLIGDDHSDLEFQFIWQTKENGCDSTVRVSGGNLNYRILAIDFTDPAPTLRVVKQSQSVPNLVLSGVCHIGNKGIVEGLPATMNVVYPHIIEALSVASIADYSRLATSWENVTQQWRTAKPTQSCSTIIFDMNHQGGRKIDDCLIMLEDATGNAAAVTSAIEGRQPIQNETNPSIFSFYVNYPTFQQSFPHALHIEVNSGCPEITYPTVDYTTAPPQDPPLAMPDQFTYVAVRMNRDTSNTYSLLSQSSDPSPNQSWPPMPPSPPSI